MDIACNGRFIITCSKVNDLIVWDLKGEQLAIIDTYLGSTHRAKISPCGRFIAASGFTPDVKVWEVVFTKSGEFKHVSKAFDLAGHSSGIYDFNFCADTSHMASLSKDGTWRFYDTKSIDQTFDRVSFFSCNISAYDFLLFCHFSRVRERRRSSITRQRNMGRNNSREHCRFP